MSEMLPVEADERGCLSTDTNTRKMITIPIIFALVIIFIFSIVMTIIYKEYNLALGLVGTFATLSSAVIGYYFGQKNK
jgi:hypothetical protein